MFYDKAHSYPGSVVGVVSRTTSSYDSSSLTSPARLELQELVLNFSPPASDPDVWEGQGVSLVWLVGDEDRLVLRRVTGGLISTILSRTAAWQRMAERKGL